MPSADALVTAWARATRAELGAWGRAHGYPAVRMTSWATLMAGADNWGKCLLRGGRADLERLLAATRALDGQPAENPATPPPLAELVVDEGDGSDVRDVSELALPW